MDPIRETIERSALFDPVFYREQNPDLPREGFDLLAHYAAVGGIENRDPNPLFDTKYYRNKYSNLLSAEEHPLVHYILVGAEAGLKPHPLFDTAHYRIAYPDVAAAGINPLAHYLQHGARDRRNPHPLFDAEYYLLRVPELKTTGVNPLVHFLNEGAGRGIKPHPLFYPAFYLEKYPDVAASGLNPLVHFVEYGSREGRDPNPMFDTLYYLKNNPDVAASDRNVLVHYLESGAREGRDPHPFFHTTYYTNTYQEVVDACCNPLAHYVEYGLMDGHLPCDRNAVYNDWIKSKRPISADLDRIRAHIDRMAYRPFFSVILPVYNTDARWLRQCLDSVLAQMYPHWEICIADDASTAPHVREVLEEYRARDSRVRVVYRKENGRISEASNTALSMAQGQFVAMLDHDDTISIDAFYENAVLLNHRPDADMIYSDEDKMTGEGVRYMPFFKPDWSPDTHLSHMYTNHLGVYRTEMIRRIGGFRIGFEGSQDYDMVLRFTEQTSRICHIPKVLYHWRTHPGSTAGSEYTKDYGFSASKNAIREALDRRGEGGRVEYIPDHPVHHRVRYPLRGAPLVSIVIPAGGNVSALDRCLSSIFAKTRYRCFEVLVVENGCARREMTDLGQRWEAEKDRFRIVTIEPPFNYARLYNEGVRYAKGDILVFLNDNTEVITENWLDEMTGHAQRKTIGAVSAILLYPEGMIRHAGMLLGVGGVAGRGHQYVLPNSSGYFGCLLSTTNYSAVTGDCLTTTKERYLGIGGMDEDLAAEYCDIDFCLRLLQKGFRNIVLSHVRLYYHTKWCRGIDDAGDRKKDRSNPGMTIMKDRWRDWISNDPYYNPNLTRTVEDYSLETDRTTDIRFGLLRELFRDPFLGTNIEFFLPSNG